MSGSLRQLTLKKGSPVDQVWDLLCIQPKPVTWKGAHWCGWCTCMFIKNLIMMTMISNTKHMSTQKNHLNGAVSSLGPSVWAHGNQHGREHHPYRCRGYGRTSPPSPWVYLTTTEGCFGYISPLLKAASASCISNSMPSSPAAFNISDTQQVGGIRKRQYCRGT